MARNGVEIEGDNRRLKCEGGAVWGWGGVGVVHNYRTLIKCQRVPLVDGLQTKHTKEMLLRRLKEGFGPTEEPLEPLQREIVIWCNFVAMGCNMQQAVETGVFFLRWCERSHLAHPLSSGFLAE